MEDIGKAIRVPRYILQNEARVLSYDIFGDRLVPTDWSFL